MSLDEVGKNEFYIACLYLVKDIIRDVEKREGFNMDRNNYHLLTDDEIFILGLYNILNSIENCLFSIENASIFMKHFFGKNYFEKYQISSVDYYQYHYDVFCFKISTLKVHIPADTRSAFPVISVQSPVSIQYRWQS